jgi:hypothetical protein
MSFINAQRFWHFVIMYLFACIHVLRFCCKLTHPLYFIWVCVFMIDMPAFILWMYRGFMTFCCYVFVRNVLRFCCNLTHSLYFIWVCVFMIDMPACVLLSKCNIDLFYICRPLAGYGFMEWTINNNNNNNNNNNQDFQINERQTIWLSGQLLVSQELCSMEFAGWKCVVNNGELINHSITHQNLQHCKDIQLKY